MKPRNTPPIGTPSQRLGTPTRGASMRVTPPYGMTPPLTSVSAAEKAFVWLGVFQGLFFLLPLAPATSRLFGIALAIGTVLAIRHTPFSGKARKAVVVTLAAVAAAHFVLHLIGANGVYPFRVWQVAIILGYVTTFVAFAVSLTGVSVFSKAWMFCGVPAAMILVAEMVISGPDGFSMSAGTVEWVGTVAPDSNTGTYYAPNSTIKTLYPDNPRHYFEELSSLEKRWTLNTHSGSTAELLFPAERTGVLRVAIGTQPEMVSWQIELTQLPIRVQVNEQYELRFRARADSARSIFASVAQAHEPYASLGLYKEIRLGKEWQDFRVSFRSTATDRVAQLYFHLGAESPSVELSEITLRAMSNDRLVQADERVERSVSYRLNRLGCRGADVADSASRANTTHVVLLGDGSTMGVGVHQRDTYATRLQTLLNEGDGLTSSQETFDVFNCGAVGSSTDDQRKIFQRVAPTYNPNVVLLSVSPDDYHFSLDEGTLEQNAPRIRFAQLFHLWRVIESARQPKAPPPDLDPIVAGVRLIAADAQSAGARFGVVLFRTQQSDDWARLDSALTIGLRDLNIPILDLGQTLLPFGEQELMVDPRYDAHPNELAHRLAAEAVRKFLSENAMFARAGVTNRTESPK